jgi:hypothetical protein
VVVTGDKMSRKASRFKYQSGKYSGIFQYDPKNIKYVFRKHGLFWKPLS